ncbi:MAG: hypothetical protein KKG47_10915 [Proteobacteria bacterium]|nr:hypothetical protein [Pseudomonadota bacterium]MBU1738615.1 hypothetical protein [Pseudomonadota bacterium]
MSLRNQLCALFLLATFTAITVHPVHAADLNNLVLIQKKFAASIRPQFEAYSRELSELEKTIAGQSDNTGLTEVRNEIQRVDVQLKSLTALANYQPVVNPAVAPEPEKTPAPVLTKTIEKAHQPTTHVNNTKGFAGAPKFSKNNIYSFNLPETGKQSNLTFYATGRRSVETEGLVWLIGPDGKKEKVTKWKAKDFKSSATEIKSYEKLDPITEDISDLVAEPGQYKVEFEWTGGIDPLVIFRVELTS